MKKGDTVAIRRAFSSKFNALLDRHDFPSMGKGRVLAVAERYDISQGSAQKWLSGATMPEIDKLMRMAQLFGVTVDDLLGADDVRESVGGPSGLLGRYVLMQHIENLRPIKVIGRDEVVAFPDSLFSIFQNSNPADLLIVPMLGNAMAPTFHDGSVVVANRSTLIITSVLESVSATSEPLVIAKFDDMISVRRIIVRDGEKLLSCDHPSYEREKFDSAEILAIVVGAIIPV